MEGTDTTCIRSGQLDPRVATGQRQGGLVTQWGPRGGDGSGASIILQRAAEEREADDGRGTGDGRAREVSLIVITGRAGGDGD